MKNLFGNKSDNKHSTQKDNTMNTLNRLTQSMNDMEEKILTNSLGNNIVNTVRASPCVFNSCSI